jgi:hypothetical protein
MISGLPALASQSALQYLLSSARAQLQDGCAHISLLLSAIKASTDNSAFAAKAMVAMVYRYKGLPHTRREQ